MSRTSMQTLLGRSGTRTRALRRDLALFVRLRGEEHVIRRSVSER